jgi:hypothetical protein
LRWTPLRCKKVAAPSDGPHAGSYSFPTFSFLHFSVLDSSVEHAANPPESIFSAPRNFVASIASVAANPEPLVP